MSRIAAGFAEGAEQRQESSGKERDGRTAAGTAGGADDLRIQHAGQCGDAGPLQRRDIGQWPRALLAGAMGTAEVTLHKQRKEQRQ